MRDWQEIAKEFGYDRLRPRTWVDDKCQKCDKPGLYAFTDSMGCYRSFCDEHEIKTEHFIIKKMAEEIIRLRKELSARFEETW